MSHSLRTAHRYDKSIVLDAAHGESYLGIGGEQSPSSKVRRHVGNRVADFTEIFRPLGGRGE
jgi:hypothetical protein